MVQLFFNSIVIIQTWSEKFGAIQQVNSSSCRSNKGLVKTWNNSFQNPVQQRRSKTGTQLDKVAQKIKIRLDDEIPRGQRSGYVKAKRHQR